jgi:tetratricopeptide (TPR) repeat protein
MDHGPIKLEDYQESCGTSPGSCGVPRHIPQSRVIEKMDEYMARRDYDGAERHLNYWLSEAQYLKDLRGELTVRNELIGHYRKTGNRDKALEQVDAALALLDKLDLKGTISSGTVLVNAATALNAFGENERSMDLFLKALKVYIANDSTDPSLLGGLYNNMALTWCALGDYTNAKIYFREAVEKMSDVPAGELEQAITYLNLADCYLKDGGMEQNESKIYDLLDKAEEALLRDHDAEDGYIAFVYEKCAPVFSYYGYFKTAEDLKNKAEELYAGA